MTNVIAKHWQANIDIIVPFYDIDAMEVTWHGHYVKYFEVARSELLNQINYNYTQMRESGYVWPIVDMRLKFVKPAKFNQKINVNVTVEEWELRLKLKYLITDAVTQEVLTRGYTIQTPVDIESGEMCFGTPDVFRKQLGVC